MDWSLPSVGLPVAYVEALHRSQAREAILVPIQSNGSLEAMLQRFDGLLLTGGGDVDPERYDERYQAHSRDVNQNRDDFEIQLVQAALSLGMPLLAICRGMQVLNVSLGGSLIQHLPDVDGARAHWDSERESVTHEVEIEPGSSLGKALAVERTTVLSRHHQAVGRLGEGLRTVAWADDGVIEGIEHDSAWAVGVQWHPEISMQLGSAHQRLFDDFARAARAGRRSSGSRYGSWIAS